MMTVYRYGGDPDIWWWCDDELDSGMVVVLVYGGGVMMNLTVVWRWSW